MVDACHVDIRFVGSFEVRHCGLPYKLAVAGPTLLLLQYLLSFPDRLIRRETLGDLFWPERPQSNQRSALNSALWRIKKPLAALGCDTRTQGDAVAVVLSPHASSDVQRLDAAVGAAMQQRGDAAAMEMLRRAVADTRGAYLEGTDEGWAEVERERIGLQQLRGLIILMRDFAEAGDYESALDCGRRILQLDPWREAVLCEVMWLHVMNGERVRALACFDSFAAAIQNELGIAPMAETRAVCAMIRGDATGGLPPDTRRRGRDALDALLVPIVDARRAVYAALRQPH